MSCRCMFIEKILLLCPVKCVLDFEKAIDGCYLFDAGKRVIISVIVWSMGLLELLLNALKLLLNGSITIYVDWRNIFANGTSMVSSF